MRASPRLQQLRYFFRSCGASLCAVDHVLHDTKRASRLPNQVHSSTSVVPSSSSLILGPASASRQARAVGESDARCVTMRTASRSACRKPPSIRNRLELHSDPSSNSLFPKASSFTRAESIPTSPRNWTPRERLSPAPKETSGEESAASIVRARAFRATMSAPAHMRSARSNTAELADTHAPERGHGTIAGAERALTDGVTIALAEFRAAIGCQSRDSKSVGAAPAVALADS
jgi:hypothetical protein